MTSVARDEYDWIDDAFNDAKPDPASKGRDVAAHADYDWIDDAFDDSKQDPLAGKGMTGCSSLAVLLCGIAVVLILCFAGFAAFNTYAAISAASSL